MTMSHKHWTPQEGPQTTFVQCPIPWILWGGSRGGGKTDGVLGKYAIKAERYGKNFNGAFFRKEMPQQDDLIERAKEIYIPLGARWLEQKKIFIFRGGGRLKFRPLENDKEAEKYQGQNLTDATVEEAGNYSDPSPIRKLFGALRSAGENRIQLILTANPGGVGHGWIKDLFIDPCPTGLKVLTDDNGNRRVFIPSSINDNKILLEKDPEYINRLKQTGSPELVRAWLEGDWSVISGAYFPEFSPMKHVIKPFKIPDWWTRIRALDWGTYHPFAVIWLAVSDGSIPEIPKNAVIAYREYYGMGKEINRGIRLTSKDVAFEILKRETIGIDAKGNILREKIHNSVADPKIFSEEDGPAISENFRKSGVNFFRADNSRVAGWEQVRIGLNGEEKPLLYIFSNCIHLIRTLPSLPHDASKPEDVDTQAEDHLADALRYGLMSRPYVKQSPKPLTAPKGLESMTYNDLFKLSDKKTTKKKFI